MVEADIIEVFREAGIVSDPPENESEGEENEANKAYFTEENTLDALEPLHLMKTGNEEEESCYTYVDFLESLIHIAAVHPGCARELDSSLERKLEWIIEKLKSKFGYIDDDFVEYLQKSDGEKTF